MNEAVSIAFLIQSARFIHSYSQELGAVFIDYKVESSKILRDPVTGQSRGVGFAR